MDDLQSHPYAESLPRMTSDEQAALKKDIAAHGLLERIILYDGKILDGRHRYAVCRDIEGFEFKHENFHTFDGTPDEALQLVARNGSSWRSLTTSQAAAAAAKLYICTRSSEKGATLADLAHRFRVAERSTRSAKDLLEEIPALFDVVFDGGLKINTAYSLRDAGPDVVATYLAADISGRRSLLRDLKISRDVDSLRVAKAIAALLRVPDLKTALSQLDHDTLVKILPAQTCLRSIATTLQNLDKKLKG